MIGRTVGNYRIVEKLGEGGMGSVYRGIDQLVERNVAIKVLKPGLATNSTTHDRFLAEAKALAKLNHPAIAMLYSFFRESDEYFMVMEYVPGQNLEKMIRTHGAIRWPQAATTVARILDGMGHAHAQGIIHRDLKPANIMLSFTGDVKITDFGIARVFYSPKITRESRVVGTMEYLAPERALGKEADERTDIYSLGVILYEMLTGRLPFEGTSEYELIRAQVEQLPKPLSDLGVTVPALVEEAMMRALAKDPAQRHPDTNTFAAQLRAAINKEGSTALRPLTSETVLSETIAVAVQKEAAPPPPPPAGETLPLPAIAAAPVAEATAPPPEPSKTPKEKRNSSALFGTWSPRMRAIAAGSAVLVLLVIATGVFLAQRGTRQRTAEAERLRAAQAAALAAAPANPTPAPPEQAAVANPEPPSPAPDSNGKKEAPQPPAPRSAAPKQSAAPRDSNRGVIISPAPVAAAPEPVPVTPPVQAKIEEAPAPAPAPVPGVTKLSDVKSIYLSPMPERLDVRLRQEIENELKGKMTVSADSSSADAVMNVVIEDERGNSAAGATGRLSGLKGTKRAVATMSDRAGKQLWTATVDDKHSIVSSLGDDVKRLASRLAKRLHSDYH